MSHISKIDEIIYDSINIIYEDLKNEKFTKIKTFGKDVLYLNIIEKYIKQNKSSSKLEELLTKKQQITKINDIIEKYIIIYCIIYFGIQFNYERDIENRENEFIVNVLNISVSNKLSQLTSILNSTIINSYKLFNNINLVIDKKLENVEGDILYAKQFIDNHINESILKALSELTVSERNHNILLLVIFNNIYEKEDKVNILQIFEEENVANAEFKYITIIDSKFEEIDYATIESLLDINEIQSGLSKSLYGILLDYDNVDLHYVSADSKINELFEKQLLIPITDDFLRYHKDSEKYEKIEGNQSTKINTNEKSTKRNDTKLKYIVTKINKVTDYYLPGVDRRDIDKLFYQPMLNRKVVLYNDTEEIAIINKFMNMGRVNFDNSEYYSDLKHMRQYPYINFKNFASVGFELKLKNYIDAIRYSNLEHIDNTNIVGSYNRPIDLRPLSKDINAHIVGVALPISLFENNMRIRCMALKDFINIRTLGENGYETTLNLLAEILSSAKDKEKIIYWIFNIEKDKLITNKYQTVSENNFESYLKNLLDNIYNNISTLTYEILTNEINLAPDNIYYLKKLINYIQDRFVKLNVRNEYYAKIQKLLYYMKIPKTINEYDKNEDKIPGINSPLIKIPTIKKTKENEYIINVSEEEVISTEDSILQNATCQHIVTFNKIMMFRNRDPSLFNQKLYEFIKNYKKDSVEGDFVCKSCSQLLDIKKFVADTFQGGVFTLNLSSSSQPLEELSKYEKFIKSIKNIDKIIERIGYVINLNSYVGNIPIVRLKRQEITKTTIDLIETTNQLILENNPAIRKKNLENAEKLYGINKSITNYFLFKLDNEIFTYTSQDTDKYKKYKYNNIVSYILLLMILDISNNQVFFLNFDKNYNYVLFEKLGFSLFNNLNIRINNSNDIRPIKNYKILCYLIYYIAGMLIKFNIWYFDPHIKENKAFLKIGMDIIINTLIHLLNTITEAFSNNKNNYLFDTISTRFFLKLNTQYNNVSAKETLEKIDNLMASKIDINNNKIKIRVGTQHSTNELTGIIQSYFLPDRKYILYETMITKEREFLKVNIPIEPIEKKILDFTKKLLFEKFNMDGSKRTSALSDEELNKYTTNDIEKIDNLLRESRNIFLNKYLENEEINMIKNEIKIEKEQSFIEKMNENYKKYYDSNYDKLISTFINKLESIIGKDININNENIYLSENVYIIDHNQLGQSSEISYIKNVSYKPDHEHFKQDVLIIKKNIYDIYYSAIENNLLGYKEKGDKYIDVKGTGKFIKINYSIENKLRYLGFDNKYINISDYKTTDIFTREKKTNKEIINEIMRNRINALKKFMEYSQKIIYQIKNKKKIQIVDKLQNNTFTSNKYSNINSNNVLISKDAQIVLNFQSKFKYINTNKENNKKILINWSLLNEGILHDNDLDYTFKSLLYNEKFIDASNLISLKDNDHVILFYTLSELAYLIELNNDNYTKSNLVFLIANIINYCYNLFNKQLNHIEFRKFKYMIESDAEIISYDQTTDLIFNQTEEEVKKVQQLNEDSQEEKDALDIEQDLPDEELDDPDTDDEFTKFEVRDA